MEDHCSHGLQLLAALPVGLGLRLKTCPSLSDELRASVLLDEPSFDLGLKMLRLDAVTAADFAKVDAKQVFEIKANGTGPEFDRPAVREVGIKPARFFEG